MSVTGVQVFDTTVHLTNAWLKSIMEKAGWVDRQRAYLALRASLHALRDRLSTDQAAHLGAQLPMLVRGFYYEGWRPAGKPLKERHKDAFLAHIHEAFRNDPEIDPERIAKVVFAVIAEHISEGEKKNVLGSLPRELRELWPAPD